MGGNARFLTWQPLTFGLLYLFFASPAAWQTVRCTNAATNALDQIAEKQSLGNQGAQVVAKFVAQHKIVGSYLASDFERDFHLPSFQDSSQALAQVPALEQQAADQEDQAARWSWLFLGLSALYLMSATLSPQRALLRHALFATTGVSALCFAVGITASALRLSTIASHFFGTTPGAATPGAEHPFGGRRPLFTAPMAAGRGRRLVQRAHPLREDSPDLRSHPHRLVAPQREDIKPLECDRPLVHGGRPGGGHPHRQPHAPRRASAPRSPPAAGSTTLPATAS